MDYLLSFLWYSERVIIDPSNTMTIMMMATEGMGRYFLL